MIAPTLAAWSTTLDVSELPAGDREAAREAVLDSVGNLLHGRVLAPGTGAMPTFAERGGQNAAAIRFAETDDVFLGAGAHPGAAVVGSVLALASMTDATDDEVLAAVIVGYEVMFRALAPVFPRAIRRGFEATGLGGPFGAAAAAGVLLRLDAERFTHALAIAGTMAGGLEDGGRPHAPRIAVRAGIESALLARDGMTGPPSIFEGARGVWRSVDPGDHDRGAALGGLGEAMAVRVRRQVKPYPTVGSLRSAIEATQLASESAGDGPVPSRIEVLMPSMALRHRGATAARVGDVAASQASVPLSVAVRLAYGRNDFDVQCSPETWADPRVQELAARVEVVAVGDTTLIPARGAEVRLHRGTDIHTALVRGSEDGNPLPMARRTLCERFVRMAAPCIGAERALVLLDRILMLGGGRPAADLLSGLDER